MLTNPQSSTPISSSFPHPTNRGNDSEDDSTTSSSIDEKHILSNSHAKSLISTAWAKKPSIKPERHQKTLSIDTSDHDILKEKLSNLSISPSLCKDDIETKDNRTRIYDVKIPKSESDNSIRIDTFGPSIRNDDQLHTRYTNISRRKASNARSLHPSTDSSTIIPENSSRHIRSLTLNAPPIDGNSPIQMEGSNTNDTLSTNNISNIQSYYVAQHNNSNNNRGYQYPVLQSYAPPHHQFHQKRHINAYYPYHHYYQRNHALPIRDTMTPPFAIAHDSLSIQPVQIPFKEQPQYIDHRYPMPWLWGTPMHQYPSHVTYPVPYPLGSKSGNEILGSNRISNDCNSNIDNPSPIPIWMMSMYGRYDHVDDIILSGAEAYESDLHQILTGVCQPLPEEKNLHDELYNTVHSLLNKHFPSASLQRFGSTENGFSLRGADLDFCVITPSKTTLLSQDSHVSKTTHIIEDPSQFVSLFGEKLRMDPRFSANIKILSRARVPIIKLKDSVTGLSCDIGVNNALALYNTKLLKVYGEIRYNESPIVVQLALLVKFWAKQRELNDPYWGTLSSYCYLMMVIYYLQQRSPPLLPILQNIPLNNTDTCNNNINDTGIETVSVHIDGCTVRFISDPNHSWTELASNNQNPDNTKLTDLLEGFFHFYAHEFNYANHVISIRTRSLITKEMKQWTLEQNSIKGSFWFCVEDPFDIDQNLARTVSRNSLFHLRGQFIRASKLISKRVPFGRICSPYYP